MLVCMCVYECVCVRALTRLSILKKEANSAEDGDHQGNHLSGAILYKVGGYFLEITNMHSILTIAHLATTGNITIKDGYIVGKRWTNIR